MISIFYAKEGVSRFSVENFRSHSTEKSHWAALCFKKILLSKNFMHRRGGGITVLSKIFCLTVPKKFVGEHFGASKNFGYRKILCIRRGYHYFPWKLLCLTVPKNFVREPFYVSEIFW